MQCKVWNLEKKFHVLQHFAEQSFIQMLPQQLDWSVQELYYQNIFFLKKLSPKLTSCQPRVWNPHLQNNLALRSQTCNVPYSHAPKWPPRGWFPTAHTPSSQGTHSHLKLATHIWSGNISMPWCCRCNGVDMFPLTDLCTFSLQAAGAPRCCTPVALPSSAIADHQARDTNT